MFALTNPCLPSADQFADTEGTTIFVKGFDKYLGEEAIRQQLTETFAECGAVSTVRLPTDRESGELKGIGFIEFGSVEAKVCTAVLLPRAWLALLHVCPGRAFAVLCAARQPSALSVSYQGLKRDSKHMADELKLWQLTDRAGGICAAHKTANMPGVFLTQHVLLSAMSHLPLCLSTRLQPRRGKHICQALPARNHAAVAGSTCACQPCTSLLIGVIAYAELCLPIMYKLADYNHCSCRTRLVSSMAQRQPEVT